MLQGEILKDRIYSRVIRSRLLRDPHTLLPQNMIFIIYLVCRASFFFERPDYVKLTSFFLRTPLSHLVKNRNKSERKW